MSAIERAAGLFASIKASEFGLASRGLAALAEEHNASLEQTIDALAFLEAAGMIEVKSVICVTETAKMRDQSVAPSQEVLQS
ncbi:MAG: hypothetical protein AAF692_08395 [Pseudomonadota bacterium]